MVYKVLEDVAYRLNRKANVAQGFRTFEEQLNIYKLGRELQFGKWVVVNSDIVVSNARPGLSWHNYGLAFDISWAGTDPYLEKEDANDRELTWQSFGKIGKQFGFRWGGDFHILYGRNDLPHMQYSYGMNIDQCVELYECGGLKGVWEFLDSIRDK